MTNDKPSLASRIFDGKFAENELEEKLSDAGVLFETIGWDYYDCSLELYDVPADYRLTDEAQQVIHKAGFLTVYVNHDDKWETHYSFKDKFQPNKGWRVSYPRNRGEDEKGIWVEEVVPSWPKSWFDEGYALIKRIVSVKK